MRLHGNLSSGYGHKVRLLLAQLGVPFERVEYEIDSGETRTARFLQEVNPNGRTPVLEADGGEFLPEPDAILFYLAEGSLLLLGGRTGRAPLAVDVLRAEQTNLTERLSLVSAPC